MAAHKQTRVMIPSTYDLKITKKITVTSIKTIVVIAEGSRDGSAKKYANKGGIWVITNTTGIPTSHTRPLQLHDLGTWPF